MYSVLTRVRGALFVTALTSLTSSAVAQQIAQYPTPANAPPRPIDRAPVEQSSDKGPEQTPSTAPESGSGAPDPSQGAQQSAPAATDAPPAPELAVEPVPAEPPIPSELEINVQTAQEDLQGLRTDLENFKFQWQRERDLHTATTTRGLKIGGVIQARFGYQDEPVKNLTGNVYKRKTSFDINSAILSFQGSLYRDYEEGKNLTYNLRFGVSKQTNTNNSFLNLLDAHVIYNFLPTINPEDPLLTLTVGQQQLPFGLEVSATEELRPVIRNAQFTTALDLARRDIGVILRGELFPLVDFGYNYRVPVLAYALGVVNGAGSNILDNNNAKDFIGRLAFTVPTDFNSWLRQFTIGATVYIGRANTSVTTTNPMTQARTTTVVGTGHSHRYGVDIYYNHWPFGVTYEYILADDFVVTGTTVANPLRKNLRRDSHTGTFFLSFGEQFVAAFRNQGRFDDWWPKTYQPFLRYDRFNANTEGSKQYTDIYTGGFNLFFAETTKLQVNYNVTDTASKRDRWTHEALAQIQFGF